MVAEKELDNMSLDVAIEVMFRESDRLTQRALVVGVREAAFEVRYEEQRKHELKKALADDAVGWSEIDVCEFVFEFYVRSLLDTMLTKVNSEQYTKQINLLKLNNVPSKLTTT